MIWHDVEQNTDEWMGLRLGKFTASSFKDLFAAKTTATYQKAIKKVAYERLTGESPESFKSAYMDRGHEMEPLAKEAYEMETFNDVQEPGFFELNEWVGASPDGLIGEDGLWENKAPAYNTMIDYLIKGTVPSIYIKQIQGQMWVADRKWCDFMCYHPKLKSLIIRVERDETIISELKAKIEESIIEVKNIINKIK